MRGTKQEERKFAIDYLNFFFKDYGNIEKIKKNFLVFIENQNFSQRVFGYFPIQNEFPILEELDKKFQEILLPKIGNDLRIMKFYFFKKKNQYFELKQNQWGIFEPVPLLQEEILPSDNDLFLIPSLGCNLEFARLGRGKGYYDVFIKKLKNWDRIKKISLLPENLTKLKFETENHDLILDTIITENRILEKVINGKTK